MTSDSPLKRVSDLLVDVKRSGKDYKARCQAHRDTNPSLSVSEGEGDYGQVLLHCHAGCSFEESVRLYLSFGLRLVPILPASKRPYRANEADPVTGWNMVIIDTTRDWSEFRQSHPDCNVAVIWPGCQIDCDSPEALVWAKARGLDEQASWVLQTGRGVRYFFRIGGECPPTSIDSEHHRPDLLGPGRLALVPPSEHPNGRPYRYFAGNSPLEIPFDHLATPPDTLLQAWRELKRPKSSSTHNIHGSPDLSTDGPAQAPGWLRLVYDAICDRLDAQGHHLKPTGNGGVTTTCPFHDDRNPSLSIHPERGWICFAGCDSGRLTSLAARLSIRV